MDITSKHNFVENYDDLSHSSEARQQLIDLTYSAGAIAVESAVDDIEIDIDVESAFSPDSKESLAEQLSFAYIGYKTVVNALNTGNSKKDQIEPTELQTLHSEFETWFTEDKLAYIAVAKEADPSVYFTLVATPNIAASSKDIVRIASGQDQPRKSYSWDNLESNYTSEQLSGTDPNNGNAVLFSLIPSSYASEIMGKTVDEQLAKFANLQSIYNNIKIPSLLEAVTYRHSLIAQGDQFSNHSAFDKTSITHINLPQWQRNGWPCLPRTYVRHDGKPDVDFFGIESANNARVSIG